MRLGLPLTLAVWACSSGPRLPCECPASTVSITVLEPDGGQVNGVAAALSSSSTVTLKCAPSPGGINCIAPAVPEGTYTLTITAPGFQGVEVTAKVTVTRIDASSCNCPQSTVQPSTVDLQPS